MHAVVDEIEHIRKDGLCVWRVLMDDRARNVVIANETELGCEGKWLETGTA